MLNTHRFLILHSMPYYSPCLFYEMLFLNLLLFCFVFLKYQKQHFQFYRWKQVNHSIWGDTVDALCDFLSDITAYGLSSSRPVHTANVAAILHFDPLPSHYITHPPPPAARPTAPLYLCLVSREKNKAPYVLVLENTWINVLFLCKKCAISSVFICVFCSLPITPSLMSDILLETRLWCLSWRVFTPRFSKSRDFYVGPPSCSACGTASSPWTRPMSKGIGC